MNAWQERQVLEARDLRKDFLFHYGGVGRGRRVVQAVERVSLTLYAGRAMALVGESGSGKTTIARILAGMHTPTQGEIRFEGRPVNLKSAWGMKHYLRNVQYVFQDPFSSLNPVHNVRHHLLRPLKLHGHAQGTGEREMQVLLEKVNLTPARQFLDKYPHQLSGGQRQRVAIARALAVQPVVLLADEPVSMLDVSLRLDVLNLLLRLKEEDGLAFLFITHDIASARYFAEETQVMYAGQMVEGGPAERVIGQPRHPYTRLLCASAPDPARALRQAGPGDAGEQHAALRSEPPDLVRPPGGCRFHPRCPQAMAVCRETLPARTSFGDGHWTRCFLYSQGEDASCI
jgi:peptide/nickel transport system ATP-binding protein